MIEGREDLGSGPELAGPLAAGQRDNGGHRQTFGQTK